MRILPLLLSVPLLVSCATDRAAVAAYAPDLLPAFDQLSAREAELKLALPGLEDAVEAAVESPDPADDLLAAEALAEANRELQEVEGRLQPIEERVIRDQAAPLGGLLPYGLGALATELLVAASSRRKRKLYASALRSLSKGQLLTTAGDILKALGHQHSSPPPEPVTASSSGAWPVTEFTVSFPPPSEPPAAPAPTPVS
jgi:hypothetical protein